MEQRIVCAANQLADGTILIGVRHWDQFMSEQMDIVLRASTGDTAEINFIRNHEQGFIDQRGNFLTRQEAWVIAEKNGQIVRDHDKCVGELYSEHLY